MNVPDGSVAILNFTSAHGSALTHAMQDGRPLCGPARWLGAALAVHGPITCGACKKAIYVARRRFLFASTCNEGGQL